MNEVIVKKILKGVGLKEQNRAKKIFQAWMGNEKKFIFMKKVGL